MLAVCGACVVLKVAADGVHLLDGLPQARLQRACALQRSRHPQLFGVHLWCGVVADRSCHQFLTGCLRADTGDRSSVIKASLAVFHASCNLKQQVRSGGSNQDTNMHSAELTS